MFSLYTLCATETCYIGRHEKASGHSLWVEYQRDSSHLRSESQDCAALEVRTDCPAQDGPAGPDSQSGVLPSRVARLDHQRSRTARLARGLASLSRGCPGDPVHAGPAIGMASRGTAPESRTGGKGSRFLRGSTYAGILGSDRELAPYSSFEAQALALLLYISTLTCWNGHNYAPTDGGYRQPDPRA